MNDGNLPEGERELASVVYNLIHKPDAADQEKLRALME